MEGKDNGFLTLPLGLETERREIILSRSSEVSSLTSSGGTSSATSSLASATALLGATSVGDLDELGFVFDVRQVFLGVDLVNLGFGFIRDLTPSVDFESHSLLEDFGSAVSDGNNLALFQLGSVFSDGSDLDAGSFITAKSFSNLEGGTVGSGGGFTGDFFDLKEDVVTVLSGLDVLDLGELGLAEGGGLGHFSGPFCVYVYLSLGE